MSGTSIGECGSTEAAGDGIQLNRMTQLNEAICMDDVWTGISDPSERKKRQNRLNQRAYKKRKAAELEARRRREQPSGQHMWPYTKPSPSRTTIISRPAAQSFHLKHATPTSTGHETETIFPLCPDHLITLVHFNVFRAMITNTKIMSAVNDAYRPCCEGMYETFPRDDPNGYTTIPITFAFTPLQQSTPHQLWIDIIPCAQLRDNLILATQDTTFDADAFCADLMGGKFGDQGSIELRGLVVWADPWSPCGWEVTEGFLEKWGYLLRGCLYLLSATNKWRATRGEDALMWEV